MAIFNSYVKLPEGSSNNSYEPFSNIQTAVISRLISSSKWMAHCHCLGAGIIPAVIRNGNGNGAGGRCLKDHPRNLGLWLFSEWNTFSTFSTFQWFQWFQFVLGCNNPSSSESLGFGGQFRHPYATVRSRLFLITLRWIIFLNPAQIIFPH